MDMHPSEVLENINFAANELDTGHAGIEDFDLTLYELKHQLSSVSRFGRISREYRAALEAYGYLLEDYQIIMEKIAYLDPFNE